MNPTIEKVVPRLHREFTVRTVTIYKANTPTVLCVPPLHWKMIHDGQLRSCCMWALALSTIWAVDNGLVRWQVP